MKIIYKAWDGTEFDERDACEKYEYDNPCVLMYSDAGRTSKADEALVILLENDGDAKRYINLCEEQNTEPYGIAEDNYGLYVWDNNQEEYFYVSELVEEALKQYFED